MTARATTAAAATSVAPVVKNLRAQVLLFIAMRGDDGATLPEIEAGLKLAGNTVRPRRRELEDRGLVVDSGKTRNTPSARKAIVWQVPARVREMMETRGTI